jgi:hypothetical protein
MKFVNRNAVSEERHTTLDTFPERATPDVRPGFRAEPAYRLAVFSAAFRVRDSDIKANAVPYCWW